MAYWIIGQLAKAARYAGVGLLLVLVLQAGCKRSTTVVGPKGGKTTLTNGGKGAELVYKDMNGADVHFAGGKTPVALPADFPSDVAIYPKAMPIRTATSDKETRVDLTTPDSVQDVEAFYKKRLKEDGWRIDDKIRVPRYLTATRNGRTLSVDVSTRGGETTIHLIVVRDK